MEMAERVRELASKVQKHKASIETEEATKNAFVMPFISNVLGYDVFNPSEVIPEFTTDVGTKKGEKIDYAVVHGGQVQVLIEAKKISESVNAQHASQLLRYFHVTKARIAVLTNGETYEFYTDLDEPNKMDSQPFLVLDLTAIDATLLPELAKLTKESFDIDSVINAAGELKYIGHIRRILAAEFKEPSDEWVRFLATRAYPGKSYTQKVKDQFTPLVGKAAHQFLTEQVNERLKTALGGSEQVTPAPMVEASPQPSQPSLPGEISEDGDVTTTEAELEAFRVVRAIVCSEVPVARISGRDSKTYFAVLLDDNNRKPVARLWFNRSKKYLGVFDKNKNEARLPVSSAEDIYEHADLLRKTVSSYLSKTQPSEPMSSSAPLGSA